MAVLNAWQRLDRVVSGKPFGDGTGGSMVDFDVMLVSI
jgi:hypothetical protein